MNTKQDTRPLLVFRTERGNVAIPPAYFEQYSERVTLYEGWTGIPHYASGYTAEPFYGWEGVES